MTQPATDLGPVNSTRHVAGLYLVEHALNTTIKWLINPIILVPLLCQWACLATLLSSIAPNSQLGKLDGEL